MKGAFDLLDAEGSWQNPTPDSLTVLGFRGKGRLNLEEGSLGSGMCKSGQSPYLTCARGRKPSTTWRT